MKYDKPIVLVVDDEPVQLRMVETFLKKANYAIILAETGEQALEILQTEPVDLILLDVIMPGIDGFETCYQIKKNKKTAEIPIIFMTFLDQLDDKIAGFEAGGVDYITKPFQNIELQARICTHIELRRQKHELEEALAQVQKLTGILPICCKCKKVRDDDGYWQQVDHYISDHVDVEFSHGYCQDCYEEELEKIKVMKDELDSSD